MKIFIARHKSSFKFALLFFSVIIFTLAIFLFFSPVIKAF